MNEERFCLGTTGRWLNMIYQSPCDAPTLVFNKGSSAPNIIPQPWNLGTVNTQIDFTYRGFGAVDSYETVVSENLAETKRRMCPLKVSVRSGK